MLVNKAFLEKENYDFNDLLYIMKLLRGENGCPWDAEQTHESIRNNFIEEVYEAIEAIDTKDDVLLKEELGDVLLQVVFHSQIAEDENAFNIDNVSDGICKKLIFRHPHVFGDVEVENSGEVLENWDKLKKIEKSQNSAVKSIEDVAKSLPSLMRSQKLLKRAFKSGILIGDKNVIIDNISGKLNIIKQNKIEEKNLSEELFGSILMSVAALSVLYDIDAEESLYKTCDSFIESFKKSQK